MTRQFAIAALAAAALAAGPMLSTEASARDGRRTTAAIGIAAGIGGALLGAAIVNAQPRHQYRAVSYHGGPRYEPGHHYGYQNVGFRPASAYVAHERECFKKPIHRFDRYSGEIVVVGAKLICR